MPASALRLTERNRLHAQVQCRCRLAWQSLLSLLITPMYQRGRVAAVLHATAAATCGGIQDPDRVSRDHHQGQATLRSRCSHAHQHRDAPCCKHFQDSHWRCQLHQPRVVNAAWWFRIPQHKSCPARFAPVLSFTHRRTGSLVSLPFSLPRVTDSQREQTVSQGTTAFSGVFRSLSTLTRVVVPIRSRDTWPC